MWIKMMDYIRGMYYPKYMIPYYTFLISIFLVEKNNVKCARNAREPPTVEIPGQGVISGKEVMVSRSKSIQFLGVPFADPPVGELRFAPPKTTVTPWSGIRNASEYAPACLQNRNQFQEQDRLLLRLLPEVQFNEDCLYLNIFIPDGQKPPEGWPVMLWFHPGNLSTGATSMWDGSTFAVRQKILVVTAAYRLNIFGFFTTNDKVAPGNYGLHDQVAALDWVMSKISIFGGAPDGIVLCGHSAGGTGVGLHLLSPLSQGKFIRAIAMSARGLISRSVKTHSKMDIHKHEIADMFGCETKSSRLIECLRRQNADHLLESVGHLSDAFGPIVDVEYANNSRAFLTGDPVELVNGEQFAKVPLLVGYTHMEEALDFLELYENLDRGMSWDDFNMVLSESVINDILDHNVNDTCLEELATEHLADTVRFYYTPKPLTNDLTVLRDRYVDFSTEKNFGSGAYLLAGALSQTKVDSFMYRFDYKIKTDNFIRFPKNNSQLASWVNAPHQFDLAFVWGMPYWTHLLRNITWNSADKKMADLMLQLWGNFVKFGNPTHSGINLKWDVFRENISGVMILDRNSNMSDTSSFDYKAFEFWNDYYPKVWNALLRGCNMSSAGVPTAEFHYQSYFSFYVTVFFSQTVFYFLNS